MSAMPGLPMGEVGDGHEGQAGIPEPWRCMARVWGGGAYPQCRAKAKKGSHWCGIHATARPNGQLEVAGIITQSDAALAPSPPRSIHGQTEDRRQMIAPAWSVWLDAQSAPLPGAGSSSSSGYAAGGMAVLPPLMQMALNAQMVQAPVQAPVPDAPSEALAVPPQVSHQEHQVEAVEISDAETIVGEKRKRVLSQASKKAKVDCTRRWRESKREDEVTSLMLTIQVRGWRCLNDLSLPAIMCTPLLQRQLAWAKSQMMQWVHQDMMAKHAEGGNPHAVEVLRRVQVGLAFMLAVAKEDERAASYKVDAICEILQMAPPPLPVIPNRVDLVKEASSLGGQLARCGTAPRREELVAKLERTRHELQLLQRPNTMGLTLGKLKERATASGLADRWLEWHNGLSRLLDEVEVVVAQAHQQATADLDQLKEFLQAVGIHIT